MCAKITRIQERNTVNTPRVIGLVVALLAALTVPTAAMSQAAKKGAPATVSDADRKAGMAKAPAIAQAIALPCAVSDARLVGEDKKSKTSYFEVACGPGAMGFVLAAPAAATASAFSCIETNTPPAPGQPPSLPCILPGNADPNALLAPMLQKVGVPCVVEKARGIGQTKTNTIVEVACQGGVGYIVLASAPFDVSKPADAQNCLMYDAAEANVKCTFSDAAARLAVVDKYVSAANNGCTTKGRRFVGMAKDGSNYYEASCQDGKGYIYKVSGAGVLTDTYECAKATQVLGGCELTDARQAQNEQAALYTRLAQTAGSNCDVEKYALFPAKAGEEVVEMVCKDGSGAIGVFKSGSKGQILDCGRAPVAGYKCSLTKPESAYSNLTADLKKFNYNSCVVSNTRVVGRSEKGTTYVEVACADGLKGYVIEYQPQPTVTAIQATGCAFSGNCKLPGNT
jgi:hypothetical protein